MRRPEQDIQIQVVRHLTARSMPGVFYFHVPNERKTTNFLGRINKRIGVVAGVPDLILLYRSQIFGLELKAGTGKKFAPSDAQVAAMNAMEVAGARCAVAGSVEEALYTLECWGVLRRDKSMRAA